MWWKQMNSRPAGSLPANLVTKVGVLLVTVLVVALILSLSFQRDPTPEQSPALPPPEGQTTVDPNVGARLGTEIDNAIRREELDRLAAQRDQEAQQRQQAALAQAQAAGGQVPPDSAGPPTIDPDTGQVLNPEEIALRAAIRLEEIERGLRSLRSDPVALSTRGSGTGDLQSTVAALAQTAATAAENPASAFAAPLQAALAADADQQAAATAALLNALAPGSVPGGGVNISTAEPVYEPQAGELDLPLPNSARLPAYDDPTRLVTPDDPPGWERVYEGTMLDAVLVTQLSGDFPGPVLAMVSVPLYSADRQRVLVPRGSRVIGTAQAVAGRDQERLAVGFHRLILPDGRFVALQFAGLNQVGESALRDQVNRHYWSMFFAAGGVGLISGLTLYNTNPLAGGRDAFQAGVGQGLGQASTRILDRFLNRLPTITIRAGHRLRIWMTADVLIPTTQAQGVTP